MDFPSYFRKQPDRRDLRDPDHGRLRTTGCLCDQPIPFSRRGFISTLILFSQMIPVMLIMMPLYVTYQQIGLYNTYTGLIIAYQLFSLPFFIWLMRSHVSTVPIELEGRSESDGANLSQILANVVAPADHPRSRRIGHPRPIGKCGTAGDRSASGQLGDSAGHGRDHELLRLTTRSSGHEWPRASTIAIVPMIVRRPLHPAVHRQGLSAGSVKG